MSDWKSLVKNCTYDRCVVMIAADKGGGKGWNHYKLEDWQASWDHHKVEDPDGFCAFNKKTGAREALIFEGRKAEAWRVHNGSWADIVNNKNGDLEVQSMQGDKPNTKKGRWPLTKEGLTPDDYDFPARLP